MDSSFFSGYHHLLSGFAGGFSLGLQRGFSACARAVADSSPRPKLPAMSTHPGAMTEAVDKLNQQLIQAIQEFDAHKIEVAIKRGASPNGAHLPMHAAMRALCKSSNAGDLECVERLLSLGCSPNGYPDPHGSLPITLAAQIKNSGVALAACRIIVEAGADIERGDAQARRALHWAAINGNEGLVAFLLDCGADIDAAVYTPGSIATRYVDPALLQQVTQVDAGAAAAGFDIHADSDEEEELHSDDESDDEGAPPPAAVHGPEEAGRADDEPAPPPPRHHGFLQGRPAPGWARGREKTGPDGHALCIMGTTPLAWAVRRKREGVVKLLLLRGAFLNSFDGSGGTPLMIAARGKNAALVSLLRYAGARDCVADTRSLQELLGASYNPRLGTGIAQRLVSRWQIAVLATQSGLFSALQCAIQQGNEACQRLLLMPCVHDIPWPMLRHDGVLHAARTVHRYAPYMSEDGVQLLELGSRPAWQGTYTGMRRQAVLFRAKWRRTNNKP